MAPVGLEMVTAYSLRGHACSDSQSTSNLATIPMPPQATLQIHFNCTPLTLRAHLATMRAPRPAKAETLGSHPSMISNRGWSLSMISTALRSRRSTNTKNDGGGPILAKSHHRRHASIHSIPAIPGVFDRLTYLLRPRARRAVRPPARHKFFCHTLIQP